jgi:hypothetical protein
MGSLLLWTAAYSAKARQYCSFMKLLSLYTFDTPVLPRVADLEPLALDEAGDP